MQKTKNTPDFILPFIVVVYYEYIKHVQEILLIAIANDIKPPFWILLYLNDLNMPKSV